MIGQHRKILFICLLVYFLVLNVNGKRKLRIINGQYGKASDFKHFATILRDSGAVCGGAIIDNRFVLTAAHCVFDDNFKRFKAKKFEILAATNSWTNLMDLKAAIRVGVEKVYVPQIYANKIYQADIAVLKLAKSLDIENNLDKLQALFLPQEGLGQFENFANYEVIFAGFGRGEVKTQVFNGKTTYHTSSNGRLRFAKGRIIKLEECQVRWSALYATDNHMCLRIIQDPSGTVHQGTCRGDSGSPLVVNNVIVGVDSGADESCNNNITPTLFTRVSSYLPFIKNAMSGLTLEMFVHSST